MADTRGRGRENVRNAVAAAATRREARAMTQQQEADIITPWWCGRRRDDLAGKAATVVVAVARCSSGGSIGRRKHNALREEPAGGRKGIAQAQVDVSLALIRLPGAKHRDAWRPPHCSFGWVVGSDQANFRRREVRRIACSIFLA